MVHTSEKLNQRSPLTDRYRQVFIESVREPSLPLPGEKELSMAGKKLCIDVQPDSIFKWQTEFFIYEY